MGGRLFGLAILGLAVGAVNSASPANIVVAARLPSRNQRGLMKGISIAVLCAGFLALTPRASYATFFEFVSSANGCFPSQTLNNTPTRLSGSGTCGTDGFNESFSDITTGQLGALASTNGTTGGLAHTQIEEFISLAPNQGIVPITATMVVTGRVSGTPTRNGPFGDIAQFGIDLCGPNCVAGGHPGVQIRNGATDVTLLNSLQGATETAISLNRNNIDIQLSFTALVDTT
jgi:hypothetical protein